MSLLGHLLFFNLAVGAVLLLGMGFAVPRRIRTIAAGNCFRQDGTFSRRRCRREIKHGCKLATNLLAALFPTIIGINSILVLVHGLIIPIPLAFGAFACFHPDPEAWQANLSHSGGGDLVSEHEEWLSRRGFGSEGIEVVQNALWEGWWLFAGLALIGCVLVWRYVAKVFIAALEEFEPKLLERQFGYHVLDTGVPPDTRP